MLGRDFKGLNVGGFGGEGLLGDHLDAFVGGIGDLRGEEADGAESIVVAGDDVVDLSGIAVGVDDGDDRDAKLAGFGDGDGFVVGVNDEDETVDLEAVLGGNIRKAPAASEPEADSEAISAQAAV